MTRPTTMKRIWTGRRRSHGGVGSTSAAAVGLLAGDPDEQADVDDGAEDQAEALEHADHAVAGEQVGGDAGEDHHRDVEADELALDDQGGDEGGDAEDPEHVKNVGADDVADGDVGLAAQGGGEGDGDLRGAGAERDDGEADDQGGDPETYGDRGGATDHHVRADEEEREADDEEDDCEDRHGAEARILRERRRGHEGAAGSFQPAASPLRWFALARFVAAAAARIGAWERCCASQGGWG
jgi:hypothetical protein